MGKTILRLLPAVGSWVIAGGLQMSGVEIPWLGYSLIGLGVLLLAIPIYPFAKARRTHKYTVEVSPVVGKREADYERTEHLMWAELHVTNISISKSELKDVQVNITKYLTLQGRQTSPNKNEFVMWDSLRLNPFCVYWSERQTQPKQMNLVIPSGATRATLIAFQDNSNGGSFNFNTMNYNWVVGGGKIDVELSSNEMVLWRGAFYIECHPNYAGQTIAEYEPSKFELVEWNKWKTNRNVTLLKHDKEGSQTE